MQTHVNITDSKPEFMNITIRDSAGTLPTNLTLNAGLTRTIICNATVRDWNGIDGNHSLNATLFHSSTSSYDAADNNNTHYTNTSCPLVAGPYGQNNVYANYSCSFEVYYYANNGSWNCTFFALDTKDDLNYTTNGSGSATMLPLYALNVTDGIEFGNLALGSESADIEANVTNFGNMRINLTAQTYGSALNDGFAMICPNSSFNVTAGAVAVSVETGLTFAQKLKMNGTVQSVTNFSLNKSIGTDMINSTFWQLSLENISGSPFGNCTGWIVFSAVAG
ncbi:MAG: hypothetical protein V1725_03570 [archaeon]